MIEADAELRGDASPSASLQERTGRAGPGSGPATRRPARASWDQARAWRAAGIRDAEIARRLGVNQSTVLRRFGQASVQEALPLARGRPLQTRDREAPGPGNLRSRSRGKQGRDGAQQARDPGARPRGRLPPPGMRGRCCCTRSSRGPPPGRCSLTPPPGRGDVAPLLTAVGVCCAPRRRDDRAVRAPGRRRGRAAGRPERAARAAGAAPGAGKDRRRSRPAAAAVAVRGGDAGRQPCPLVYTSMTTSSPIRARNRWPRAGTTSVAGPSAAAPTRT